MRALLPLIVLLGVAGCGQETASKGAAGGGSTAGAARSVDDSVAAISLSSGKPAVQLRFALAGKPRVGVAGPVRLDLSGEPGSLTLRVQGEGLSFEPAAAAITLPQDGTPASQTIQVTPQAAGFSEIMVRIQPPGDGAAEILYAVPLLAEGEAAK